MCLSNPRPPQNAANSSTSYNVTLTPVHPSRRAVTHLFGLFVGDACSPSARNHRQYISDLALVKYPSEPLSLSQLRETRMFSSTMCQTSRCKYWDGVPDNLRSFLLNPERACVFPMLSLFFLSNSTMLRFVALHYLPSLGDHVKRSVRIRLSFVTV